MDKESCKAETNHRNMDKENCRQFKITTRIPLPQKPLPVLPKHVLINQKTVGNTQTRRPLQPINCIPGPSNGQSMPEISKAICVDTRYVTTRKRGDDLDWNLRVFKDHDENIIVISDDEGNEARDVNNRYFQENNQINLVGASQKVVTPWVSSVLEPSQVRNIKKSLKRPHSRELQGISPAPKELKNNEKAKRQLRFDDDDDINKKMRTPDPLTKLYMKCMSLEDTEEMFMYLIRSEQKPLGLPRVSSAARECVLNWLVRVNGTEGNPATIQTACWYMDSILGTANVDLKYLQLVGTACYWIAQKLHGRASVARRLVTRSNNAFTAAELVTAERNILNLLRFPQQPVVPQDFITYLSWWCDCTHPGEIEVAATFLCMAGLSVSKRLCDEYPSVIGAAAVRNAVLLLSKRSLMIRLRMSPVFKEAEKKAQNMPVTCSILRKAVRTLASPTHEYKAIFQQYGIPPYYIAQKIVDAASKMAVLDTRNAPD